MWVFLEGLRERVVNDGDMRFLVQVAPKVGKTVGRCCTMSEISVAKKLCGTNSKQAKCKKIKGKHTDLIPILLMI